jgi:glycosyltransferase involved in cell wall biosynthesis
MDARIRVLELRSVWGTGGGPEKTILSGAAMSSERFDVTVCYIRDRRDSVFAVGTHASALAVNYIEIGEQHSFDPSVWANLRSLIRRRGIQIVHAHDYKTNLLARLVSHVEPIIPLSTVHGWTGQSWRERLCYYPVDKRLLAWFPRLIAVSGGIRDELVRHGAPPERIVTVLNGIDHHAFHRDRTRQAAVRHALGLTQTDIIVGAVGRLERQKRFDVLIEAFARVKSAHPNLKLMIVGDGTLHQSLQTQVVQQGLTESCGLLGHRTDIADLHHAFDLFVQSSDYEGTPNAVLEAMALETPIVATGVGGTAELVRDGIHGLIVPPNDAAALARSIENILMQPEQTAGRLAAARRRVEIDLSFEGRMRAVEHVYDELIESQWRADVSMRVSA